MVEELLSKESWEAYQNNCDRWINDKDDPQWTPYKQRVKQGSHQYPAICLGAAEIIEICGAMNRPDIKIDGLEIDPEMEIVQFRLPSRTEWQIAARGITAMDDFASRRHFPNWIDPENQYLEKEFRELRGKIWDIKAILKEPFDINANPAEITDQHSFMEFGSRAKNADDKTYSVFQEVFGRLLKISQSMPINVSEIKEIGKVRPCNPESPSSHHGFHHLLGNAPEWTLGNETSKNGQSLNQINKQWDTLLNAKHLRDIKTKNQDHPIGFIMGGTSLDFFETHEYYSVDHGIPDPHEGNGRPYFMSDCIAKENLGDEFKDDEESKHINLHTQHGWLFATKWRKPTVRLALIRTLSPRWFVRLRRHTVLAESADASAAQLKAIANTINNICTPQQQNNHFTLIDIYKSLANQSGELPPLEWHKMLKRLADLKFNDTAPEEEQDIFSSLMNQPNVDFFVLAQEVAQHDANGSGAAE